MKEREREGEREREKEREREGAGQSKRIQSARFFVCLCARESESKCERGCERE